MQTRNTPPKKTKNREAAIIATINLVEMWSSAVGMGVVKTANDDVAKVTTGVEVWSSRDSGDVATTTNDDVYVADITTVVEMKSSDDSMGVDDVAVGTNDDISTGSTAKPA